jgi:hypothetical protein
LYTSIRSLNQRHKALSLTEDEVAELEGILELDRIFTLLNAKVIAEV